MKEKVFFPIRRITLPGSEIDKLFFQKVHLQNKILRENIIKAAQCSEFSTPSQANKKK